MCIWWCREVCDASFGTRRIRQLIKGVKRQLELLGFDEDVLKGLRRDEVAFAAHVADAVGIEREDLAAGGGSGTDAGMRGEYAPPMEEALRRNDLLCDGRQIPQSNLLS